MIFKKHILACLSIFTLLACSQQKINGVSLVSPPKPTVAENFVPITKINANWVSVIPYAMSKGYTPEVMFNSNFQWWGEKKIGTETLIKQAKENGLKVMLKPHIWFGRSGSATEFHLNNEKDWLAWEKSYSAYILAFAQVAANQQVDLFCISTELKQVVIKRPEFFKGLIKKVKTIYKGKLTYAANWDNFKNVTFWSDLDYIGVDAYFPLSNKKEPELEDLLKAWQPIKKQLKGLSDQVFKPVLFTEYGFESCDYNVKQTWGSYGKYTVNEQNQTNAYQAFYDVFYNEKWFAGGFLWKWHLTDDTLRNASKTFTPQNKSALKMISNYFDRY